MHNIDKHSILSFGIFIFCSEASSQLHENYRIKLNDRKTVSISKQYNINLLTILSFDSFSSYVIRGLFLSSYRFQAIDMFI
jgi:hypothetical protein